MAVVFDREGDRPIDWHHAHRGATGSGVLSNVRQRLLDDAEELDLGRERQMELAFVAPDPEFHRDVALLLERLEIVAQRLAEPAIRPRRGPQSNDRFPYVRV